MTPCPLCQHPNNTNQTVCPNCGASLLSAAQRAEHIPDDRMPDNTINQTARRGMMIYPIGFAIFALVVFTRMPIILIFWPIPHIFSLFMGFRALQEIRRTGQMGHTLARRVVAMNLAALFVIGLVVVVIAFMPLIREVLHI